MAPRRVGPLQYNTPIVDAKGRPTPEFMQKWTQQGLANGTIPQLSTPEQVSALLDILAATPASLLIRGSAMWQGLELPDDPALFLNGEGGFTAPPTGPTYGVVTDTADGLAPMLPGDATKFLNGEGAYTVPAGGGGGGGKRYFSIMPGTLSAASAAAATHAQLIMPAAAFKITTMDIVVDAVAGATYRMMICTVNPARALTGLVELSPTVVTTPSGGRQTLSFTFSGVMLTPGQGYGLCILRTGAATNVSPLEVVGTTTAMYTPMPLNIQGQIVAFTSANSISWYVQNSIAPAFPVAAAGVAVNLHMTGCFGFET